MSGIAYASKSTGSSGAVGQNSFPSIAQPTGVAEGDLLLWVLVAQEGSYGWGAAISGGDIGDFDTLMTATCDPGPGAGFGRYFVWMGYRVATSADVSRSYTANITGSPLGASFSLTAMFRLTNGIATGARVGTPGTDSWGTAPGGSTYPVPTVTLGDGSTDSGRTIAMGSGTIPSLGAIWAGSLKAADASETVVVLITGGAGNQHYNDGTGTTLQDDYAPGVGFPNAGLFFSSDIVAAVRGPRFRHIFPTD